MVFQEPMVSLNPALTIGRQMSEALKLHTALDAATIRERCIAMLQRIGIKDAEKCLASYPHQFSGGMRQRIMLASVMLLRPALLIADEPTTALDVTIQSQILAEMQQLCAETGTALIWITHDLTVIAGLAQRVAGQLVQVLGGLAIGGGAALAQTTPAPDAAPAAAAHGACTHATACGRHGWASSTRACSAPMTKVSPSANSRSHWRPSVARSSRP